VQVLVSGSASELASNRGQLVNTWAARYDAEPPWALTIVDPSTGTSYRRRLQAVQETARLTFERTYVNAADANQAGQVVSATGVSLEDMTAVFSGVDITPLTNGSVTIVSATTHVEQGRHGSAESRNEVLAAAAEEQAVQVAEAANELTLVLATESELSPPVGQMVIETVSLLLGLQADSSGSNSSGTAAANIGTASEQLARAAASWIATAGISNTSNVSSIEPVVLASPNLNMTLSAGLPAALTAAPITCESGVGVVAAVEMPTSIFDGIRDFDSAVPVVGVLTTSPVNLHAAVAEHTSNGSETGGGHYNDLSRASSGRMSPTVTFFFLQNGVVLPIRNATPPINIHLPYIVNTTDRLPCIGEPVSAEAAATCDVTVQCRYWDTASDRWSTAGCETILDADGMVICSCTHLTEFIAFEFPTSREELLETALVSTSMNSISEEAWTCAINPSRSWRTVPAIWGIVIFLFILFITLLSNAIARDRHDVRTILALVQSSKRLKLSTTSRAMVHSTKARSESPPASPPGSEVEHTPVESFVTPPRVEAQPGEQVEYGEAAKTAQVSFRSSTEKNESFSDHKDVESTRPSVRWLQTKQRITSQARGSLLARRWHKDVDRVWKRVCLSCLQNHTLCSGILYRGQPGFTRAQTTMILLNSFAFELIILCLFYTTPPAPEEPAAEGETAAASSSALVTFNIVGIVISGTFAALIVIPTMLCFAWLYNPIIFVNIARWALRLMLCWPSWLWSSCRRLACCRHARMRSRVSPKPTAPVRIQPPSADPPKPSRPSSPASSTASDAEATGAAASVIAYGDARLVGLHTSQDASAKDPQRADSHDYQCEGKSYPSGLERLWSDTKRHTSAIESALDSGESSFRQRQFSKQSLNDGLLKASLTHSWARKDWPSVRKILFGWSANVVLYLVMVASFVLHGCSLFEPRDDPTAAPAGNTDELLVSWSLSAVQRFVLHEPTLILAAKGVPILFASSFCANCCSESIVNFLSIVFNALVVCLQEVTRK